MHCFDFLFCTEDDESDEWVMVLRWDMFSPPFIKT